MKFTSRIGKIEELDEMCEIEISAMPDSRPYLRDNADYFFNKAPGEIFVIEKEDGELVGIGRYSTLPDKTGWLETLRVKKEYQNMGAGKMIYKEYIKKGKNENAPYLRMYTEDYNIISKTLAEKIGFSLATEFGNMELNLENLEEKETPNFKLVKNIEEIDLDFIKEKWGKFISLNRTFFEVNEANLKWMIEKEMVYKLDDTLMILGARMLEERGLFLSLAIGNVEKCIDFGVNKSLENNFSTLVCLFSNENKELRKELEDYGFDTIYNLYCMEMKL